MLCNDLQRIGGRRRFEKFANDTPRNGPVAVRLIQGLQILMIASLAHSLINGRKFLMRGLKCGNYGGKIANNPIF